jgi:hypothetical protein
MTFTSSSNANEPSTPLLGKRPQHKIDEEQGCIPCPSLTLAIVYDDDDEESCQKAAEDEQQWTNILSANSVVLLAVFFIQFGIAFFMSPVEQATMGLPQWSVVNYSIVLSLVITTALYRQTVQDFQITCLVATVAMVASFLGLVLCGQVVPAFLLLLNSMLCMGVFVAVRSIRFLVDIKIKTSLEEEYDEESVHDEFGVGFEPLWTV